MSSIFCHLHILELQDVVCVPLGNLKFWSNSTNAADHIVVIPNCQTLKGPVAAQEKLLNLTGFFRTESMDWMTRDLVENRPGSLGGGLTHFDVSPDLQEQVDAY